MRWIAGLVLFACVLTSGRAVAADEWTTTSEQEAEFFRWWDGLGFPDVGRLTFVQAATANWIQYGDDPKTTIYENAFLVADQGKTFDVFTTDLHENRYAKTADGVPECDRIGYRPLDLLAFVRDGVAKMKSHEGAVEWHEDAALDPFRAHRWLAPNQAFRLLVLARACAARGASDLAHDLFLLALREQYPRIRTTAAPTVPERLRFLREDMASEARRAAIESLADETLPLATVRDRFRRLATAFPEDAANAEDAMILDRMVVEAASPPPAPENAGEARVERLLRRLRDERGIRWAGWEGTHEPAKEGVPSTNDLLAAMGFDAVPRLLAALEDPTFTRSVLWFETGHGQFREWCLPYRVRDAAIDVLDRIAAGAFRDEEHGAVFAMHPADEEKWADVIASAKAWWGKACAKGEEATLVEVVRQGGRGAAAPARRLVAAFPAAALPAIRPAIAVSDEDYAASRLVEAAADLAGPESTDFLLEMLRTEKRIRMRLTAATALLRRGRREGIEAMAEEWLHPTERARDPKVGLPSDPGIDGDLLSFLASSGDAVAYRALAKDLGKQSLARRYGIVAAFLRESGTRMAFATGPETLLGGRADVPEALAQDASAALEDLLGERLGDQSGVEDVWMSVGGADVDNRIGHVAARALAAWFPSKYRYDPTASPKEREAERLAAENAWRAGRGLPPVKPAPERPRPAPLADDVVLPLVARFRAAAAGDARAGVGREIETLGLGTLPVLLGELRSLPKDDPARADLERTAARLASVVTEVRMEKESLPADAGLETLLADLLGKPFEGEALSRIVVDALSRAPGGAVGVGLRAARADDLTGVVVIVGLTKEVIHGWGGPEPGWSQISYSGPNLRVGDRVTARQGGATGLDYCLKPDFWKDRIAAIDEAFLAPPDLPVVLGFSIGREE